MNDIAIDAVRDVERNDIRVSVRNVPMSHYLNGRSSSVRFSQQTPAAIHH
jgi:hypothetical protein